MNYKLCDTCNKVELKGLNLFSENDEEWINFPHPLPILGKKEGSQELDIIMGKQHADCIIYYWGSRQMFDNLNLEYPDSYIDSMNNGLMKLDKYGECTVNINCPQPYKDRGVSYMSHIHILVSDKKMTRWKKNIYTQNVLCNIDRKNLNFHLKQKDRLLINALPEEYYRKSRIPGSFNIDYNHAKKMSNNQLVQVIKKIIAEDKSLQTIIKKNKLKLTEVPIIVYCYDKKCDAGHKLANELFRCGFTNIVDYKEGILGYMARTRYE